MESKKEAVEPGPPDTLRVYGFSFDFPSNAKLEFNPKFDRQTGDVAVKFQGAHVFISWGQMEKLPKKVMTTEDHANYSVGRVRASTRGKIKSVDHRTMDVNGHRGVYSNVIAETQMSRLVGGGKRVDEAQSMHIHCEKSGRFFVIFAAVNDQNRALQSATFDQVVSTLRCH